MKFATVAYNFAPNIPHKMRVKAFGDLKAYFITTFTS